MAKQKIWRVRVSDGIVRYFDNQVEADFFAKDTSEAGLGTMLHEVPMPATPKEFVAFMEREEEERRHDRVLLAQIGAAINRSKTA